MRGECARHYKKFSKEKPDGFNKLITNIAKYTKTGRGIIRELFRVHFSRQVATNLTSLKKELIKKLQNNSFIFL